MKWLPNFELPSFPPSPKLPNFVTFQLEIIQANQAFPKAIPKTYSTYVTLE